MGHDKCLGTGTFLQILGHEGIMLSNLPLLVVEVGVGLVVGLALRVAIGALVGLGKAEPTAADVGQDVIILDGVGHAHAFLFNIYTYHRRDAHRIGVDGADMLHDVVKGR